MKKKSVKSKKSSGNSSEVQRKEAKNLIEEEAKFWSKDYTNEHIRAQIKENSVMFSIILGLLAFATFVILLSLIIAFIRIVPEVSLYHLFSEWLGNQAWGLAIGITLMVFAGVGIHEADSLCMIKHIWPACSGRRLNAREIDVLVNAPDTIWFGELGVFATTDALIGIYKGITVIEYEDIANMGIKVRHNMKKITNGALRGRMSAGRAMYYALTDHYDEWDTYYIVVWTKKHRRFILTEVQRNDCESLIPIIKEKCSNAESILKGI